MALAGAFDDVRGGTLSKPATEELHATVAAWARRSLEVSDLDEPAFLRFLSELTLLIGYYRRDERIALADDAEEYLRDAQRLSQYAVPPQARG